MLSGTRFRQGMRAAVPIWIAFVPSSIAWSIAAQLVLVASRLR
jgi:predicted branched-subunit amino acid permease